MVQILSRLEFPTESYGDFSGQWSAERCCLELCFYYMFLLRILRVMSKAINRFVLCCFVSKKVIRVSNSKKAYFIHPFVFNNLVCDPPFCSYHSMLWLSNSLGGS
jgi:hypothetical protein